MKRILILFMFVLFINFSQASQTIKVVSVPDSIVELTLIEHTSSYMQVIKRLNQTTDKNGETTFVYNEELPPQIDIYSKVKKKSYVLFSNKFFSHSTAKPISLFLFPEGTAIPNFSNSNLTFLQINNNLSLNNSNATIANNTNASSDLQISPNNIQEQTQNSSSQITGAIIAENSTNNSHTKYIFYIITIGIILGLAIFFFYKKNQNKSQPFQHHGKIVLKEHSSSAHNLTQDNNIQSQYEHKKLSISNQEFLKLKSQRKMEELKRRMQQDLDEFKRLEKEF